MTRGTAVAALDVGTSKVLCAVAVPEARGLRVVGFAQAGGAGVRRGAVVDVALVAAAVREVAQRVRRHSGEPLPPLLVGSAGGQLFSANRHAEVAVAGRVGPGDVAACGDALRRAELPAGYQLVHVIPQQYTIDGYEGCRDPAGMAASNLALEAHLVACETAVLQNLWRAVEAADLRLQDFALAGLAAAEAVLTEDERENGVLLLDCGAGATQAVIVSGGEPVVTASVPLGGEHVTADIAAGLRLGRAQAEEVKRSHGQADAGLASAERRVPLGADGGPPRDCSESELAEIVSARVEEIVQAVVDIVARRGRGIPIGSGAVLTGGAAALRGLQAVAMRMLAMPVRLGGASGAPDALGAPASAAAVGLLQMQALRTAGGPRLRPFAGTARRGWLPRRAAAAQ